MAAPASTASVPAWAADAIETSANTHAACGALLMRRGPVAGRPNPASVGRGRALRPGIFLEQLERPHAAAGWNVGEVGIARAHDVGAGRTAGDGEVLLAVVLPGDRLADDAGRGLEFPQGLAGVGIECDELAGEPAGEDEAARGHQGAGEVRGLVGDRQLRLAGEGVDRARVAAAT